MTEEEYTERPLAWEDISSPAWYPEGTHGSIWITAYLIMMADRSQLIPEPIVMDFGYAKALAFYGQMPYIRLSETEPRSTTVPIFSSTVEEVTSQEGSYLLLVLPFDDSRPSESEVEIRARTEELVGILTSVFGPNIAYNRLFDNVVRIQNNQRSVFGESFRAPTTLPVPDISQERIQIALDAVQNLSELAEDESNRVRLSLRWYSEAQYARGVDLFLKLWFALEALGMSERDNVRSIVESMARAYQLTFDEAKKKFSVGRLFGFRSRIVHQGEIHPIHALLSDFVGALYLDVLFEKLNLPHEGFAARIQNDPEFDLLSFLR